MKSPKCGEFPFSHIQTFCWKEILVRPKLRINMKPDENKIEFYRFLFNASIKADTKLMSSASQIKRELQRENSFSIVFSFKYKYLILKASERKKAWIVSLVTPKLDLLISFVHCDLCAILECSLFNKVCWFIENILPAYRTCKCSLKGGVLTDLTSLSR